MAAKGKMACLSWCVSTVYLVSGGAVARCLPRRGGLAVRSSYWPNTAMLVAPQGSGNDLSTACVSSSIGVWPVQHCKVGLAKLGIVEPTLDAGAGKCSLGRGPQSLFWAGSHSSSCADWRSRENCHSTLRHVLSCCSRDLLKALSRALPIKTILGSSCYDAWAATCPWHKAPHNYSRLVLVDELMINLDAQAVFCSVCLYSLVVVGLSVHDQILCRVVLAVCLACLAKTSAFP